MKSRKAASRRLSLRRNSASQFVSASDEGLEGGDILESAERTSLLFRSSEEACAASPASPSSVADRNAVRTASLSKHPGGLRSVTTEVDLLLSCSASAGCSVDFSSLAEEIPANLDTSVQSRREALEAYRSWRHAKTSSRDEPCDTMAVSGSVEESRGRSARGPFLTAAAVAAALSGETCVLRRFSEGEEGRAGASDDAGDAEVFEQEAQAVAALGERLFSQCGWNSAAGLLSAHALRSALLGSANGALKTDAEKDEANFAEQQGLTRLEGTQCVVQTGVLSVHTASSHGSSNLGFSEKSASGKRRRRAELQDGSDGRNKDGVNEEPEEGNGGEDDAGVSGVLRDANEEEDSSKRRRRLLAVDEMMEEDESDPQDVLAQLLLAPLTTADPATTASTASAAAFKNLASIFDEEVLASTACPTASDLSRRGSDLSAASSSLQTQKVTNNDLSALASSSAAQTFSRTRRRTSSSLCAATSTGAKGTFSKSRRRVAVERSPASLAAKTSVSSFSLTTQELRRSQRCVEKARVGRVLRRGSSSPDSFSSALEDRVEAGQAMDTGASSGSSPSQVASASDILTSQPCQTSLVFSSDASGGGDGPHLGSLAALVSAQTPQVASSLEDFANKKPKGSSGVILRSEERSSIRPEAEEVSGGEELFVLASQKPKVEETALSEVVVNASLPNVSALRAAPPGFGFYTVTDGAASQAQFPVVRGVSRDNTKKRWAVYWKGYRRYFYDRLYCSCAEAYRRAVVFREQATRAALAVTETGDCQHLAAVGLLQAPSSSNNNNNINNGNKNAEGEEVGNTLGIGSFPTQFGALNKSLERGDIANPSQETAATVFAAALQAAARVAATETAAVPPLSSSATSATAIINNNNNNNNNNGSSRFYNISIPPAPDAERTALYVFKEAIGFVLQDLKCNVLPGFLASRVMADSALQSWSTSSSSGSVGEVLGGTDVFVASGAATHLAAADAARRLMEQLLTGLSSLAANATTTAELQPLLLLISPCVRELKLPRLLPPFQQALLLRSAAALQAHQQLLLARYLGATIAASACSSPLAASIDTPQAKPSAEAAKNEEASMSG